MNKINEIQIHNTGFFKEKPQVSIEIFKNKNYLDIEIIDDNVDFEVQIEGYSSSLTEIFTIPFDKLKELVKAYDNEKKK